MFKRLLIGIFFFVIVCGSLCFWAIHSPSATAWIASALIKKNLKSVRLDELTIGSQQFVYPGQLFLSDVHLKLTAGSEQFTVSAKELDMDRLSQALAGSAEIPVNAKGVSVGSANIQIPSADIEGTVLVRSNQTNIFQGAFTAAQLEAYRYKIQNISTGFVGGSYGISFKNLSADFYKGKVVGKVDVNWAHGIHYKTGLQFEGIDFSALKDVDASVYGQVEGIIHGSVTIGGSLHTFDTLRLKMQVTKDGRINASLLKFVLPYIPQTEGSAKLLDLMKHGLKVPVEVAHVDIRNVDEHKLSGNVKLGVGQLNLDLNLPIDILYDGNLFTLIEWYRKLGK